MDNRGRKAKLMEPATTAPKSPEEAVKEIKRFTPLTSNIRINVPQTMSIKRDAEFLQAEISRLRKRCKEAEDKNTARKRTGEGASNGVGSRDRGGGEGDYKARENERLAQAFRELAGRMGYAPRGGGVLVHDTRGRTYASVTEGGKGHEATIEGVGKEQRSTEVIKLIKNTIRPENEGIKINNIYGTRRGTVKVTGSTKEDAERLCRVVEKAAGSELRATVTRENRPRVAIKFIDKETTDDQLLDCFLKLNRAGERYSSRQEAVRYFVVKGCVSNRRQSGTKLAIV